MHEEEPSLLNHLDVVRSQTIPEGGISTVIYCGKVIDDKQVELVLQKHRIVVENEVNNEEVNITGILIGQGNSVIHLLEGPSFSVLRILSDLSREIMASNGSVIQHVGSIVYCVEDRPSRFFPEWYSTSIQEKKSANDEVSEENCKDIVFELSQSLLEVGKGLHVEQSVGDLQLNKYADRLPGKNLVNALSNSPLFFSLSEFIQFYFDPYHVDLESEQSWPLERLVNY